MSAEDARLLVSYHYWARDRVMQAVEALDQEQYVRPLGSSFPSVRDTLVHVYSSEWIWFSRWRGVSPTAMLDPATFPDLASLRAAWDQQQTELVAFIESRDERSLHEVIAYRTTEGKPFQQVLWHILQHVVNHASYHRGQVTTMLRQMGANAPKSQDLIVFYRELQRPT